MGKMAAARAMTKMMANSARVKACAGQSDLTRKLSPSARNTNGTSAPMGTYPNEMREPFWTYALHGIHTQTAATQREPKMSVRMTRREGTGRVSEGRRR